jgi:hypothetical protein
MAPSISPLSLWNQVTQGFPSILSPRSKAQLQYWDLGFNGVQSAGTCVELDILLSDLIPTTLITHTPVSLSLFAMSGSALLALSSPWTTSDLRRSLTTLPCDQATVTSHLLSDLRSLSSLPSPLSPINKSYSCGANEWNVMRCGGDSDSLVLCANCSNYCEWSSSERSAFPFAISCVNPPNDYVGQLSMLYLEFNDRSPPPSFLSREVASVTDTTVTVDLVMSGPGYVVCGSSLASATPPSSSEILALQSVPIAGLPLSSTSPTQLPSSSTFVSYLLSDLIPSSAYDIYCASLSTSSIAMPSIWMLRSKMSIQTDCCPSVFVTLHTLLVDDFSPVPFALSVSIENVNVEGTLQISISGYDTTSFQQRELYSPSILTFTSSSTSSRVDLTYLPVLSGSYRLNVSLAGSAQHDYKVMFPAGDRLVVKRIEEFLSPPSIRHSKFSSDGSRVTVTFSSPTDRGGVWNVVSCFSLFASSLLQSKARCLWITDSAVQIYSIGSSLNVGDQLRIKKGVLKARCTSKIDPFCSSWKSNDLQNVTISSPDEVLSPVVAVSMASEIGPCDDLNIDLTSSSGSGGRLWKSFSVKVVSLSPNATVLQDYLSSLSTNPSSSRSPISIPHSLLSSGYSHSFEITLCNFLGGCGMRVKSVVVSTSFNVPVVFFHSQGTTSMFRNSSLSLFGDSYVPICGGGRSSVTLSYSWTMSLNNVLQASLSSISVNPREFRLPPYALTVGSLYIARLTVTHLASLKVSSMTAQVFVKSADVLCVLSGSDDMSLRVDGSLLLDMSGSYDSNLARGEIGYGLLFSLTCFQISPVYKDHCNSLVFTPLSSSFSQVLVRVNESSRAVVTTEDKFRMTMKGRAMSSSADSRSCERIIQVSLLASLAPVLTLEVLSGLKMNPSSKLKILGTIDMTSPGELSWSLDDESIPLSVVSLSPISRSLPAQIGNSPQVMSLALVGNCLPQSSIFTFTLTCSLTNGYSFSSSVRITTNSAPFGGVLEVKPDSGVMLDTRFLMTSLNWVDEDLPLSYQFGYLTSLTSFVVLRSKLELSHTSTLLPSGFPDANGTISNLTCVVFVFDHIGSSSQALSEVSVSEVVMSVEDLENFLLSGVNNSQLNNNPDDLKNSLSATSSVLNRVNCSGAPDCSSLHRSQCSWVEGTCGECLFGYVGTSGFSNTRCILRSSRRSLTPSTLANSTNPCESDVDCESDPSLFLECNLSSKVCVPIQQSCPNSCSGHGRCIFKSKSNDTMILSECSVLDVNCVSLCTCDDGFMGSSCSYSAVEFLKRMSLRALMVEAVRDLVTRENRDETNLISWIQILSSIGSDSLSLSLESKLLMTSLTIDILGLSRDLVVSVEELFASGLDRLVDMCVSGLSSSFSTLDLDAMELLMQLLQVYGDAVTSDMIEGQFPVSSATANIRSSSFYTNTPLSSSSRSKFAIPETELESLVNSLVPQPSSLTQQSLELSGDSFLPLQLSISEIQPSISASHLLPVRNSTQLSVPLVVSLHGAPCSTSAGGVCKMKVFLQNRFLSTSSFSSSSVSRTLASASPTFFDTVCVHNVVDSFEYVCPTGEVLSVVCNGTFAGQGRTYCPLHSQVAACETSSTSSSSGKLSCQMEGFNESTTICVCDLMELGVIGASDSVSFSFLSVQKSVTTEFVSNWKSAATLSSSDVRQSLTVLLTISSLASLFLFSLLVSVRTDDVDRKSLACIANDNGQRNLLTGVTPFEKKKAIKHPKFVGVLSSGKILKNRSQVKEDMKLIDESLPKIFKSETLWTKFKEEMRVYHRWLGILFYYSPVFPRSMRVLSLFTSITIMLFVQSVTYNIADPDDGSCEACDDLNCCLSLKSTLSSNEARCVWLLTSSSDESNSTLPLPGSCHFREISDGMIRMFIAAMLSSVVSALPALSIQYLICNVLAKEVIEQKTNRVQSKMRILTTLQQLFPSNLKSRKRSMKVSLEESCGKTTTEDLKNLQKDLTHHYNSLVATNAPLELEEFRGTVLISLACFSSFLYHLRRCVGTADWE